jgi:hypothetical protein
VEEEMGITLTDVQFLRATNNIMTVEQKHYMMIFMGGCPRDDTAVPRNLELHKCVGEWQALNADELGGRSRSVVSASRAVVATTVGEFVSVH